jgi:hypothetical protein
MLPHRLAGQKRLNKWTQWSVVEPEKKAPRKKERTRNLQMPNAILAQGDS